MKALDITMLAVILVSLSACVSAPPRERPSAAQLAAVERTAISIVSRDGNQGTGVLVAPHWMLLVRHVLSNEEAADMDGLGADVRGDVVLAGEGDLHERVTFAPSLDLRLRDASCDWRVVRTRAEIDRSRAAALLPLDTRVNVGDRVVIGGFIPRTSGPGVSFARMREPHLWSSLGIVTRVHETGAFAVVLQDEHSAPGCSGAPVIRLNSEGEPEAVVGLYTGTHTGLRLPRIVQQFGACAPVTRSVVELIEGANRDAGAQQPGTP